MTPQSQTVANHLPIFENQWDIYTLRAFYPAPVLAFQMTQVLNIFYYPNILFIVIY